MPFTVDPRRNTNVDYFLERDPLLEVSPDIVEFIAVRAGRTVLDLGCGIGGYAYRLQERGLDVTAVDRNAKYVERTLSLGIRAKEVTADKLPFEDDSFDTVYLVEVLEHIPDEVILSVLSEVHRVARQNVLFTVPDCTQSEALSQVGLTYEHFLTEDHVQFFTVESMTALLRKFFPQVIVEQGDLLYPHRLLPPPVRRPLSLLYRLGWLRPTIYSRLYVEARKHV
jgi:SAM-dependent methyltransferase